MFPGGGWRLIIVQRRPGNQKREKGDVNFGAQLLVYNTFMTFYDYMILITIFRWDMMGLSTNKTREPLPVGHVFFFNETLKL